MKKQLAGGLAVFMLMTAAAPVMSVTAETDAEENSVTGLELSRSLFSLTEIRTVEVEADLGTEADPENIIFKFGGQDISEWGSWSGDGQYDGEPFITVTEGPELAEDSSVITAELEFGLPYGTDDLSNRTIRTEYQDLIGDYELALIDSETGVRAAGEVRLNVYDEFLFNDELKPAIDEIFAAAEEDTENERYLEYQKVGESAEGRDIHFVILARDEAAVDTYLEETLPAALEDPASLLDNLENDMMGDYQVPIWFNNIHPDEVEGVDAQIELLKKFALEDEIIFETSDENGEAFGAALNMDDVLDDAIFLYLITSNPDGREANTRTNAHGFDLNRDNTYQTQVETQQVNELISKWTPLSFLDMHGYVDGFLIEPATPPHNPNFEYDLLIDNMFGQAHAMGRAGTGVSQLDSYFIPKADWGDGWDDMTPAYTAIYAMLHGSLGHTIEVPTLSQDSLYAMVGTGLGATHFVTENKDELFANQLQIFERGVNGEDNRAVDEHYVNADGESIGRVRGEHDSFFPDYYVIPADEDSQKNVLEAYKMAEYLLRNGINIEETTEETEINGTTYPAGTFVVPMNQAKRGLANAVLYSGDDVSDWGAMYDPIVVNFPALRGFDTDEIREPGSFDGVTAEVDNVELPTGDVTGNPPKQIVKNNTNDAIKLVNDLLAEGKNVEVAAENKGRITQGDFIVETSDLQEYTDIYYFEAQPLGNGQNFETSILSQPAVAAAGSPQLYFTLNQLGFHVTEEAEADIIVDDSGNFNAETAEGKAYIGMGAGALESVQESGVLEGFEVDGTGGRHEGLVKADIIQHQLTSGYSADELLYVTTGAWISQIPEGAEVLAEFAGAYDFYIAGWWPGHNAAQGQTMAFSYENNDTDFTLFANSLAFRAHTEHSYRMLANTIFASTASEAEGKRGQGNNGNQGQQGNNGRGNN
ncbi:M14 family metallopeptidase [Evansella clarkii]|uniref:M14 family metallopeptidase n=1 Tax=Evansella clarkii TaxID=79879 RepID=UPI000B4308CD|nr:M14 family zinc carboxypeptidase [Evansella clarkii]